LKKYLKATIIIALLIGTSALASSQTAYGTTFPFQSTALTNAIQHFSNGITLNCGDTITTSVKLKHDIVCTSLSNGIVIQGNNIVLDCNGHSIKGIGIGISTTAGIRSFSNTGVTIKNCKVNGFDGSIVILGDYFDHLKDNKATNSNNNGFFVLGGLSNLLESNEAQNILGLNQGRFADDGSGFTEYQSSGDILVDDKSDHNAGYGFWDNTSGAGIGGTKNGYFDNNCNKNTLGNSSPVGLC
jgi:hypothetical protein